MKRYKVQLHECIALSDEKQRVLNYYVEHGFFNANAQTDFPIGKEILGKYADYHEGDVICTEEARIALLEICVCEPMLKMLELMLPRKFPPYITRDWSGNLHDWYDFTTEQKEKMSKICVTQLRVSMILENMLPIPDGTLQNTRSKEEIDCICDIIDRVKIIDEELYNSIAIRKSKGVYAWLFPMEMLDGSNYSVVDLRRIAEMLKRRGYCKNSEGFSNCFTDHHSAVFDFCKPINWGAITYIVKRIYSDNKNEGESQNVPSGIWDKLTHIFTIEGKSPRPSTLQSSNLSNTKLQKEIDSIFSFLCCV